MLGHLGPAARTVEQVQLDLLPLLAVDRVEGIGAEELLEVGVAQASLHAPPIPASMRLARIRRSPARMRLLTVPSGASSASATWR